MTAMERHISTTCGVSPVTTEIIRTSAPVAALEARQRVANQLHTILGLDSDHVVRRAEPAGMSRQVNGERIPDESMIRVVIGGNDTEAAGDIRFLAIEQNGVHQLPTLRQLGARTIGIEAVREVERDIRILHLSTPGS